MYCWYARRQFADSIDGRLGPRTGRRLEEHLASCALCAGEHAALAAVASAVRDAAGQDAPPAPGDFETRLFAAIRSRRTEPARGFERPAALPLAASVVIMVAAAVVAALAGGPGIPSFLSHPTISAVPDRADPPDDGSMDRLVAPEEIRFTVDEDLVGTRRGRIPATTYVLEPAPEERPVMRASL